MKMICKTRKILRDNKGESMVEVIVAFTLLSLMLVLFSEGMAWATNSEVQASANRDSADQAMIHLQQSLAGEASSGDAATRKGSSRWAGVSRCEYVIDGKVYVVYQPVG